MSMRVSLLTKLLAKKYTNIHYKIKQWKIYNAQPTITHGEGRLNRLKVVVFEFIIMLNFITDS